MPQTIAERLSWGPASSLPLLCEPLWCGSYKLLLTVLRFPISHKYLLFMSLASCRGQHSSSLGDLELMGSRWLWVEIQRLNSGFTENCLQGNTVTMSERCCLLCWCGVETLKNSLVPHFPLLMCKNLGLQEFAKLELLLSTGLLLVCVSAVWKNCDMERTWRKNLQWIQ